MQPPSGRGDHRQAQRAACARTQRPRLDYDGDGDGSARVGSPASAHHQALLRRAGALRLVFRPRQRRCDDRLYDGQPHARGRHAPRHPPAGAHRAYARTGLPRDCRGDAGGRAQFALLRRRGDGRGWARV